jgi:tyrosine decarboxylase
MLPREGVGGGGGGEEWLRPMDAEQLRECGHRMVDFVADYYKSIEAFPVLSQVQASICNSLSLSERFLPADIPVQPCTCSTF